MSCPIPVELHDHGMVEGGRYRVGITASHGYPRKFIYCEMEKDGSSPVFTSISGPVSLPDGFAASLTDEAVKTRKSRRSRSFDYPAGPDEYETISNIFKTRKPAYA